MKMEDNNSIQDLLAQHPRLCGAVFSMCLVLSQAGSALATNGSTGAGP